MSKPIHFYGEEPISRQLQAKMNHRGMGFSLTEVGRNHGIDDNEYFARMAAVTVAPEIPLVEKFTHEVTVFDPRPVEICVDQLAQMRERDGLPRLSGREWLHFAHGFEYAVPIIRPPYDHGTYADFINAVEYYVHLLDHPRDLTRLPAMPRADLIRPEPLGYIAPTASGPVTHERIEAFTIGFPGFGGMLSELLDYVTQGAAWHRSEAAVINEIISAALGIDVDARVGSLVSADDLSFAQRLIYVQSNADLGIPRIDLGNVRVPDQRLHGACWSVAADAVLNQPGSLCEVYEQEHRVESFNSLHSAFDKITYH